MEILCGRYNMDIDVLWALSMSMVNFAPQNDAAIYASVPSAADTEGLLSYIVWRETTDLKWESVFTWLDTARGRSAKLEVDKVYGIVGLIQEDWREEFKVDYSKTAAEVYLEYFTLCMSRRKSSSLVLHSASNQLTSVGLPSWCPNLSSRQSAIPLPNCWGLAYGAGKSLSIQNHQAMPDTVRLNILTIKGYQIDIVSNAIISPTVRLPLFLGGDPWNDSYISIIREFLDWESKCYGLTSEVYSNSAEDHLEVHSRTMIADYIFQKRCGPLKVAPIYQAFVRYLSRGLDIYSNPLIDDKHITNDYILALSNASLGRSFLATRNGRVGLRPASAQPGDVVVLIPNSSWPFIFRAAVKSSSSQVHVQATHEYIGNAYIHGIMDGELMNDLRPEQLKEFVLG